MCNLIQPLGRAHAGLDGQAADVLPTLLQQRHEVVDGQHDVGDQLILGHADVSNSDTHAQNLLQLELDGGLDFGDFAGEIFVVRDGGGEFASLGETGAQETGNLLDQRVRGDKGIVLAGEFLDQLLVLVQLLQVVGRHGVNTVMLGSVNVVLVTENTVGSCQSTGRYKSGGVGQGGVPDCHARSGNGWQLDGSGETLVTLRVIVLEADLQFDRLEEVSLLLIERVIEQLLHVRAHSGCKVVSVLSSFCRSGVLHPWN